MATSEHAVLRRLTRGPLQVRRVLEQQNRGAVAQLARKTSDADAGRMARVIDAILDVSPEAIIPAEARDESAIRRARGLCTSTPPWIAR